MTSEGAHRRDIIDCKAFGNPSHLVSSPSQIPKELTRSLLRVDGWQIALAPSSDATGGS